MKKTTLIAFALFCLSCNKTVEPPAPAHYASDWAHFTHTYESDDDFIAGEILYPDYVHTDTLQVVDADQLNLLMRDPDIASDGDISDILSVTTKIYNK